MKPIHIQYVTNDAGEKTSVIIPISEFEELMEDIGVYRIKAAGRVTTG